LTASYLHKKHRFFRYTFCLPSIDFPLGFFPHQISTYMMQREFRISHFFFAKGQLSLPVFWGKPIFFFEVGKLHCQSRLTRIMQGGGILCTLHNFLQLSENVTHMRFVQLTIPYVRRGLIAHSLWFLAYSRFVRKEISALSRVSYGFHFAV